MSGIIYLNGNGNLETQKCFLKKSTWAADIKATLLFAGGFDQEHGRFQGDGKYTWACGRSFVGSFKAGVPHGYGEMRFPKVSCAVCTLL